MADLNNIAGNGHWNLLTSASLSRILNQIKLQTVIAGNGVTIEETESGTIINGSGTAAGTQTFYHNMTFIPQPDCSMTCCAFAFQNPFSSNATMAVSGDVDDDLSINGVIPDFGHFPFYDDPDGGCPGSGFLNGSHFVNYTTTVFGHQIINFLVIGNYRGVMGFNGSVTFTAPP